MDTSFLHFFTSTMYLSLGYVLKLFYIYICVCVCVCIYIYIYIFTVGSGCKAKHARWNRSVTIYRKKIQVPGVSECLQQVNADMFVSWLITGNRTHPERSRTRFHVALQHLKSYSDSCILLRYSLWLSVTNQLSEPLRAKLDDLWW